MATDFHCFWGYISHLINLLQMKVKVKCLFNLRFCLGMHLFFWRHTMFSSSISLSPDLKQRQQGRKVEEAVSFFFMAGEKKSVFFMFLLRLLWSEEEQCSLRLVIVSSSRHLWKSQISSCSHTPLFCAIHWKEPIALFSVARILWPGLLEPSRRKLKWLTWAYV